jgi:hypothetical protein
MLCFRLDGSGSTCARSCLLRGDALASTTLDPLSSFNAGKPSGGGGPGGGLLANGVPDPDLFCGIGDFRASSYDGGGSDGSRGSLTSIVAGRECVAIRLFAETVFQL